MNRQTILIVILSITTLASLIYITVDKTTGTSNDNEGEEEIVETCGYDACKMQIQPNKMNIHIVAHTHDDSGWLSTVDEYYINRVNTILNTVVLELNDNPNRMFTWVEISFFSRWWREQSVEKQKMVKRFVKTGQLQFALGHWTMADEAVTYYADVIENAEQGMRFLEHHFGSTCGRPLVGWQVDPFGHSTAFREFFKEFGYDGFFIGRIDHEDYHHRMNNDQLEFMWGDMWTSVNYNVYRQPPDFCWDVSCDSYRESNVQNNGFMVDDVDLQGYNIEERVDEFLEHIEARSGYTTDNFMITMGNDFHYINANKYFVNIDKLIHYVNLLRGDKYNAFYSTPTCYMKAVKESKATSDQPDWPVKQAKTDFFPYCDGYFIPYEPYNSSAYEDGNLSNYHGYWSGYYTSRVSLKKQTRESTQVSFACNQWEIAGLVKNGTTSYLRQTMSLLQHHDAVTGTEKKHVVDDYSRRLTESVGICENGFINDQNTNNYYSIYNPLAWDFDGQVEIPKNSGQYVKMQLPAMSETILNTNMVSGKRDLIKNQANPGFSTEWRYYESSHNQDGWVSSGAYIFRPWNNESYAYNDQAWQEEWITSEILDVQEEDDQQLIEYKIGPIPTDCDRYEALTSCPNVGKEVILRFNFDQEYFSYSKFFTDANSYNFIERNRSDIRIHEPISSRYFPITSQAYLEFYDANDDLTECFYLTVDRSIGVASLENNQLEIMLHRRTMKDDWKGMGEAMDDSDVISGKINIKYGECISNQSLKKWEKTVTYGPQVRYTNTNIRIFPGSEKGDNLFPGLIEYFEDENGFHLMKKAFPETIHLLSCALDTYDNSILNMRLENLSNELVSAFNLNDYFKFVEVPKYAMSRFLSATGTNSDKELDVDNIEIPANSIVTMQIYF